MDHVDTVSGLSWPFRAGMGLSCGRSPVPPLFRPLLVLRDQEGLSYVIFPLSFFFSWPLLVPSGPGGALFALGALCGSAPLGPEETKRGRVALGLPLRPRSCPSRRVSINLWMLSEGLSEILPSFLILFFFLLRFVFATHVCMYVCKWVSSYKNPTPANPVSKHLLRL